MSTGNAAAGSIANPGASGRAIERHYDLPSEFWQLWLGKTMTYSCARWDGQVDLDAAQVAKSDHHIDESGAATAKRVLDVGCGWGATMVRLNQRVSSCTSVGLTLSPMQARFVQSLKIPRSRVSVESWSDHSPTEPYDAVISIGAFEHFARPEATRAEKIAGYRAFFMRCREWLAPEGRMSLQTIAYGNAPSEGAEHFMAREIYPESQLPRLDELVASCEGLFEIVRLRNDRHDYTRTCREWLARLQANRSRASQIVGPEVVQRYETYLKYCIIGFHTEKNVLLRATMRRLHTSRV